MKRVLVEMKHVLVEKSYTTTTRRSCFLVRTQFKIQDRNVAHRDERALEEKSYKTTTRRNCFLVGTRLKIQD